MNDDSVGSLDNYQADSQLDNARRAELANLGLAPWLLVVAAPVIVVILAFNFLGDGLRDAANPYR